MKLAWRNICHDRMRFAVTVVGIAFAVFLMVFQGSLLTGFVRAASKAIDATDGDIWITARGVDCFEFATPLPKRFRDLAMGAPGVQSVSRMAVGFATWKKPSGMTQLVLLVGAERGVGRRFPVPSLGGDLRDDQATAPEAILVDQSNTTALEVTSLPLQLEVADRRATTTSIIDGFGSFFGTPYVFTGYADSITYLHLPAEETYYLVARITPGSDAKEVQRNLQARLPEGDVWLRDEFARHSQRFWVVKTGAGGALLTAAFLGFLVGLVVVSQNIYATTMENIEEFATLKAMGASRAYVQRVVIAQALVCGIIGSSIGALLTIPATRAISGMISWIYTPWLLPVAMVLAGLGMCALASVASIRKAVSVEPGRVFRA